MPREIKKVAVLGSGVMGGGIAAHLANAGIPTYLLDIVPRDLSDEEKDNPKARNRIAEAGLQAALKAKPKAFMDTADAKLITVGNFDDNMDWLKEVDWVIEVVVENPEIKQKVFATVEKKAGKHTIISSNTSGIPIKTMTEGRKKSFKKRFLVTHFFNPVRYMKLLELVAGPETDPEIVETIAHFGEYILGKGIVYGKDTTNFVANRIGVHSMMATIHYMADKGYSIKEVDAIVGAPLGRPKTAAFKTADLVGLDTFMHVAKNCYDNLPDDEDRDVFQIPDFITKMVESGKLGNKTKAGFYKKDGKERFVINPETLEYEPLGDRASFDSVKALKDEESVAKRIKGVTYAADRAGTLVWDLMKKTLPYAARRVGEIADRIVDIDNGMKWGFNWQLGPFESWDAIGVAESVERMKAEGVEIPAIIEDFLDDGNETFYKKVDGVLFYYDFASKSYAEVPVAPEEVSLADIKNEDADKTVVLLNVQDAPGSALGASLGAKAAGVKLKAKIKTGGKKLMHRNSSASIIDLGDGVLNLEFHSKMNALDGDIIEYIDKIVDIAETEDWHGVVVSNQGENFSVGANLLLIYMGAQQGEWKQIEGVVRQLQAAVMRLKYSKKPTVTAPAGLTLGGGCEVAMHGQHVVAAGETYIGLVELGAGVIPAGGGTKEMILRAVQSRPVGVEVDLLPFISKAFQTIGTATVAESAKEGKIHGFLRPTDTVILNKDHRIHKAKQTVLGMSVMGHDPGKPETDIRLPGKEAYAALKTALIGMHHGNYISDHDMLIASKLAHIMTGGDTTIDKPLTEQDLLDMECEAFLSLCGEEKSQARMESLVMKGKPLRN